MFLIDALMAKPVMNVLWNFPTKKIGSYLRTLFFELFGTFLSQLQTSQYQSGESKKWWAPFATEQFPKNNYYVSKKKSQGLYDSHTILVIFNEFCLQMLISLQSRHLVSLIKGLIYL